MGVLERLTTGEGQDKDQQTKDMRYGIQNPDRQITFLCTPELHASISDACRALEVDRSTFLRRAARKYIREVEQIIDPVTARNSPVTSVTPLTPQQRPSTSSPDTDLEFLTKADPAYVSYLEHSDFNMYARRNLAAERVKELRNQSASKQTLPQTPTETVAVPTPPRPAFDLSNIEGNTPIDPFYGKHMR
jgi:hypothetical protein